MDARNWVRKFIAWYNEDHHHSGIGLMPPKVVHYGDGEKLREQRALVLEAAYAAHPERFVGGKPAAPALPKAVWINPPTKPTPEEVPEPTTSPLPDTEVLPQAALSPRSGPINPGNSTSVPELP